MPYISALYCAAIPSLADRRKQLSRKFLKSILEPSSCLSSLLPNPRDPSITTRLRSARLPSRTRKYQIFISYALYQIPICVSKKISIILGYPYIFFTSMLHYSIYFCLLIVFYCYCMCILNLPVLLCYLVL